MTEYKSPAHKILKVLKDGRDQWKEKTLLAKYENKKLKQQLKYAQHRIDKLSTELEKRTKEKKSANPLEAVIPFRFNFNTPVARHEYSLEHIDFALNLLSAPSPIRTTGSILQKIKSFLGMDVKMPSWYSIRLWLLKLGLFKLQQPKDIADDWIWIVDHSIQTGAEKCLVVLGIRAKDLPKNRALGLSDVEPLAVMPVTTSDKTVVCAQLDEVAHVTGVPYAIISDAGPDLKAGIEVYCALNPYRTRHIYDVTHWIALESV